MKGQDDVHVLKVGGGNDLSGTTMESGLHMAVPSLTAAGAKATKGCIGCLVDGLEHSCGFTALPVVPSRWLHTHRY